MNDGITNWAIVASVAFGVMYFGGSDWRGPVEHKPAASQHTDGQSTFTIQAGIYETTYSLGRPVTEDILAVSVLPQRKQTNPLSDFHSQMVSFTPKAANKYVKKYPGTDICPAPFLRRHANRVDLYAANSKVAKQLSQWKRQNGGDVNGWENVSIVGNCVKKRTKIVKNGEDVTDSTRLIVIGKGRGDCLSVYVRSIEIRPANIFGPPKSRI